MHLLVFNKQWIYFDIKAIAWKIIPDKIRKHEGKIFINIITLFYYRLFVY